MSFMEPEITLRDHHWRVETTAGTWFVPGKAVTVPEWIKPNTPISGPWIGAFETTLQEYVEPSWDRVTEIEVVVGYCGRLSAPGYLDATEWVFARSMRDIREQLDAIFIGD